MSVSKIVKQNLIAFYEGYKAKHPNLKDIDVTERAKLDRGHFSRVVNREAADSPSKAMLFKLKQYFGPQLDMNIIFSNPSDIPKK